MLSQRRLQEAQRVQLEQRGRPGLRGQVDGERGHVADGELVLDAVEVAVHVVADDLDRLHPELVVAGAAVEVAKEGLTALPLERSDDQLDAGRRIVGGRRVVDPAHAGGVEGDIGDRAVLGGAAGPPASQDPVGDPFGIQRHRPRRAAGGAGGGHEPGLIPGEVVGHLFGQPLDGARREDVRGVAFDELPDLPGPERIAVHVQGGRAGSVFERLLMTFETALGVGAGDAFREVRSPLGRAVQVRTRHTGEALAAADVGAAAVERVELRREQLVTELERLFERRMAILRVERIQIALIGVHGDGIVHEGDSGQVRHDGPRHRRCQDHDTRN